MATQSNFSAEEWTLLRTAPAFVAGGMSASDPSGIFSSIKESAAGAGGMSKATPEAASAYQQMLVTVAEKAAHASKEGGFLGFGGTRGSSREQAFLEELKSTLRLV